MRRYGGKFVDSIWIRQRMDAKDARFARMMARRTLADQLAPTSVAPPRFLVGDVVEVTNEAQIGEREMVVARGVVEAITGECPAQQYAVSGLAGWQRAATLRLVLRGGGR
jgi:hypothetical protein